MSPRFSKLLKYSVFASAGITAGIVLFLVGYIVINGIKNLSPNLFEWTYTSENVSLIPALFNTLLLTLLSLLIATPLGIFSAIWLVEYAKRESKLVLAVRLATETLSGIPSIIYGLFGMLLFVVFLGWGYSLLAGAFTLAVIILPLIIRTTETALLSVPDSYREGSFALGAGKLRTVFAIVLPSAKAGILAGIILAIGRVVGETAALIFTAGTVAKLPENAFSSVRTLSVHVYNLAEEGLHIGQAYATAFVLLLLVLCINAVSGIVCRGRQ